MAELGLNEMRRLLDLIDLAKDHIDDTEALITRADNKAGALGGFLSLLSGIIIAIVAIRHASVWAVADGAVAAMLFAGALLCSALAILPRPEGTWIPKNTDEIYDMLFEHVDDIKKRADYYVQQLFNRKRVLARKNRALRLGYQLFVAGLPFAAIGFPITLAL